MAIRELVCKQQSFVLFGGPEKTSKGGSIMVFGGIESSWRFVAFVGGIGPWILGSVGISSVPRKLIVGILL